MTTAPYYSDDLVTLYLGDCLTIPAWLDADALVTDPPYGINWEKRANRRARSAALPGIAGDATTRTRDQALAQWGPDRPGVVFGSFHAPTPAGVRHTLVWRKPIDAGVVGSVIGYRTDIELMFLIGQHVRRPASRSSVLETNTGAAAYRSGHPHAKPPALLEYLMEWLPAGTIADPFAGSGSTLVAAKLAGRPAIGVELEERFAEIAARRLSQGTLTIGTP